MQQLLHLWSKLELKRQIVVIIAVGATFLAIFGMSRMATSPSMTLLYAGLESSASGEVVSALEQRDARYEIRGDSIFVESALRDQLRMTLASEGLPTNSNRGYELLDDLSGFGTTSQMFDAAYWRAKEGELARTIVGASNVSAARVHIANTSSNPFQRSVEPKASVSITPKSGEVSPDQAKAIRFLVSSAVAGLSAENVAVIDGAGRLIGSATEAASTATSDDKAKVLKERVERLLEARVGAGNAIVEVSVDTVLESEAIRERTFDPESRVAISTDTEERSNSSTDSNSGNVTIASNLPDEEQNGDGTNSAQNSETRERINYEVSEVEREVIRGPGAIKRITVAVLINNLVITNEAGEEVIVDRQAAELDSLKELVSSAVGFDATRGDQITIKSMELKSTSPEGTLAESSLLRQFDLDIMSAIQMAILALVSLVLGLFVIRPLLLSDSSRSDPDANTTLLMDENSSRVGDNERSIGDDDFELPELPMISNFEDGLGDLPDLASLNNNEEDPVDRLRNLIGERQDETVEILRSWLEDEEENV